MANQHFNFLGKSGHRLSGRIERPQSTPRGWAIFAHCFTCGKDSLAAVRVSRALALHGIGVLRFDFAGLGTSGGAFADATFAADVGDLIAAGRAMADAGMASWLPRWPQFRRRGRFGRGGRYSLCSGRDDDRRAGRC